MVLTGIQLDQSVLSGIGCFSRSFKQGRKDMGGLSIWHWIIFLVFLMVAGAFLGLLVWFFARASRKSSTTALGNPDAVSPAHPTVESRLLHLDDLWAKGVITESEYEQQRSAIIKGI